MSLQSLLFVSAIVASEAWQPLSMHAAVRKTSLHAEQSEDVTRAKEYLMNEVSGTAAVAPPPAAAAPAASGSGYKQSFLEATPYFNQEKIPVNTFKAKVGNKWPSLKQFQRKHLEAVKTCFIRKFNPGWSLARDWTSTHTYS